VADEEARSEFIDHDIDKIPFPAAQKHYTCCEYSSKTFTGPIYDKKRGEMGRPADVALTKGGDVLSREPRSCLIRSSLISLR